MDYFVEVGGLLFVGVGKENYVVFYVVGGFVVFVVV